MDALNTLGAAPSTLADLALNLLLAGTLGILIGLHYRYLGASLANRVQIAKVLVFLALTTAFVIAVVKSSLALSLGLVGALSIVRFRTPIKEPEELAYLFMAIAVGLGMGADYRLHTVAATAMILAVMTPVQLFSKRDLGRNLYLSIGIDADEDLSGGAAVGPIEAILGRHCAKVDLRRMDREADRLELTFFVDVTDASQLQHLTAALEATFPRVRVTFVDQSRMPGL